MKIFLRCLFFVGWTLSVSTSFSSEETPLSEGIRVIGHRGTTKFAPENTLPAFEKAIELGAHMIEFDVRETLDGELVVMHDATVDRTTDGKGLVNSLTLSQIKALDAGSWFDPKFKGVRVPTFREALAVMKGRILPDVDYKAGHAEKIRDALLEAGFLDNSKVTLYHWRWAKAAQMKRLHSNIQVRPDVRLGWVGLPVLLDLVDPPIINIRFETYSERLIESIHRSGKMAWVNLLWGKDLLNRLHRTVGDGVDFIQTDDLDIVVPYLKEQGLYWRPKAR